jgi:hypothetical protein
MESLSLQCKKSRPNSVGAVRELRLRHSQEPLYSQQGADYKPKRALRLFLSRVFLLEVVMPDVVGFRSKMGVIILSPPPWACVPSE